MAKQKLIALFTPAVVVLALDQLTKWIVRTSPDLHQLTLIEGWLNFYYTRNPGMAMGIDILSTRSISIIAIIATVGIIYYLIKNLEDTSKAYLVFMGLILGGAFGNLTDRFFMGYVDGDGGFLEGHVVDFIYFSLKIGDWTVFPYIFNVADMAISVSIITLLIFNKRLLNISEETEKETETEKAETEK